jgi:Cof subfamily protein (haloacid dehalogenase superfamily)
MDEPPIAAVLADVDGTLVTRDKVLTPHAVRLLRERGVLFAITSGRPPRGLWALVAPLGIDVPMAAFNGGVLVMPDMTVVDERQVPVAVAPAVVATMRSYGADVWVYHATEWYLTDRNAPHVARESGTVRFMPTTMSTVDSVLDGAVKIVGVSDDTDRLAECEAVVRQRFGTEVSAARSQPYYLDVTNPSANKGVVVERLAHHFGIPMDRIATLGDQGNDVLMFSRSGTSIAMGNASPEVQRQATYVTASHDNEGFAKAIERYVLRRVA